MPINIMNRANARVVQSRSGSSLLLKSLQGFRIAAELLHEEFQRDESTKSGILRLVDNTHTPDANSSENPIMRNCLADHTEVPLASNDGRVENISCREDETPGNAGRLGAVTIWCF
jgi:hypothetical protein